MKSIKFNRNQLKYLALVAMVMDHIAPAFPHPWYELFRFFGRITAPIMCFFLSEGFRHTHNRTNYLIRLGVFAFLSQFAFVYAHHYPHIYSSGNMILTLFFCALILVVLDSQLSDPLKVILASLLGGCTLVMDWGIAAPVWVVLFYKNHENRSAIPYALLQGYAAHFAKLLFLTLMDGRHISIHSYMLGTLLAIPLIHCYNGKPGSSHPFHKYMFYLFYPLHLVLLPKALTLLSSILH
ncbi:MAG: hypothetical protein IJ225_10860 [Solobacterium sp.]|nr:hypothetical protein [Solobacterium sp.]